MIITNDMYMNIEMWVKSKREKNTPVIFCTCGVLVFIMFSSTPRTLTVELGASANGESNVQSRPPVT